MLVQQWGFSPLAGIFRNESQHLSHVKKQVDVSVPLRGFLGMKEVKAVRRSE